MTPERNRFARRSLALVALLGLVALLATGCPGAGGQTRRGAGDAVIQFDCPVADAEVWLDGRYLVDALRRGISVAPGTYRIEVRHDRYHSFYTEVTVHKGERRVVEVRLAEILP